jgi:hypothetical protein
MSAGVVPAGTTRLEPSGSVTEMSLIGIVRKGFVWDVGSPTEARHSVSSGRAKVGRHGQTRTADLLRVKQAL